MPSPELADLTTLRCVPCEGGVPPLDAGRVDALLPQVPGWTAATASGGERRLRKRFTFRDFAAAMAFLNRVAALAESEGHHPDFHVSWNKVDFEIWTHAIGGLSENDFILAAKIERLVAPVTP